MKKLLPFCFLLIFVTAQAQEQITLKFTRPALSVGVADKIVIAIQNNEYVINDGSTITVNVTPSVNTSLKIDCSIPQGPQTNFYLESKPNETYYFQVGLKKTGIYIIQLSGDASTNTELATQPEGEKNNESWNTKLKVDRKNKGVGFTAEKGNETQAIRDNWMKTGGTVNLSSQLLTLIYFRSDMGADFGVINGYGYGFSLGKNQIKLKVPQFKTGMSSWNSLNYGLGMDFNTYSMNLKSSTVKMGIRNINVMFVGNIGWTIGLGKFLDENNWKGMAFTIKYRPTLNMTIAKTDMTMDILGTTSTSSTTSNSTNFNAGGFGFDWEFSSFTSTMNKIAPPPKMKFSFFFLPPIKSSPLFITFSLGVVYYGTKGSASQKRK